MKGCYWFGTGVPGILMPLSTELCLSHIVFPYDSLQAPLPASSSECSTIFWFFVWKIFFSPWTTRFLSFYFFKLISLAFPLHCFIFYFIFRHEEILVLDICLLVLKAFQVDGQNFELKIDIFFSKVFIGFFFKVDTSI